MDGKEAQEIMFNTVIIREMHLKTPIRYYYTSTRKAKILKTDTTKC